MNRAEQAEKTTKALYGGASALGVTDPEFAAIKERLIYGEVYAEEKLSARLRELVILVVATTNQTMNEVKRHTAAALACGVKPEEIKEAVYHCAPYIGLGKAENAVNAVNAVFAEKGIVLPLTSGQTVTEESRLLDGIAAQKSIFGDHIDAMRAAAPENQKNIQDYADIGCTYQGGGTDCKGDVRAIRKRRAEARRFSVLIFRDGYAVAQLKSGNGASLCIGTVQIVFDLPLGQPQHLPFLYPLHHRAEPAGQRQQREKCQDTVEHKWMCRRPLGVKAAYAQPDQNRQKLQAQEQSEHQPDCKDKQNKCGESKKYLLQDRHSKNLLYLVLLLSHTSKIVSKNRKINQFRRNAAQFETHFDSRKEQPNIRHEAVSNHLCRSSMAI